MKLQIELQIAVVGAKETVRHLRLAVQAQEHEFRQRAHVWFDGCIDMTSA